MKTNQTGLDLIKQCEGLRLRAYLCPSGIPTVGWGSTRGVDMDTVITIEQAEERLLQDLEESEKCVSEHVSVPLSCNQFSALVSFVFNVGSANFARSTLLRLLNQGQYDQVPAQLSRWIYGRLNGAKVPRPGLVIRRRREADLFLSNDDDAQETTMT